MKKGIIVLFVLIITVLTLAGCSGNGSKPASDHAASSDQATPDEMLIEVTADSLNGTWAGDFETWTFKKNGKGKITENGGDLSADFDYELPGDGTVVLHVGSPDDNQTAECKLTDSSLNLTFDDERCYILKKQ